MPGLDHLALGRWVMNKKYFHVADVITYYIFDLAYIIDYDLISIWVWHFTICFFGVSDSGRFFLHKIFNIENPI